MGNTGEPAHMVCAPKRGGQVFRVGKKGAAGKIWRNPVEGRRKEGSVVFPLSTIVCEVAGKERAGFVGHGKGRTA